jgi:hypothetical protein
LNVSLHHELRDGPWRARWRRASEARKKRTRRWPTFERVVSKAQRYWRLNPRLPSSPFPNGDRPDRSRTPRAPKSRRPMRGFADLYRSRSALSSSLYRNSKTRVTDTLMLSEVLQDGLWSFNLPVGAATENILDANLSDEFAIAQSARHGPATEFDRQIGPHCRLQKWFFAS